MALRTTAPLPTRTPGISTLPSTTAPSSTMTFDDSTELRTVPAEMMHPEPTTESSATPPWTNLAGGRLWVSPRMGQRPL